MSCFSIKNIRKSIILALSVIMSITVVGCSGSYPVKEQKKLTDEEIKQDIIVPLQTSNLLRSSWDNANNTKMCNLANYYISTLSMCNKLNEYKDIDRNIYTIPQDIFEDKLTSYYDVDVEYLRSWYEYNADRKVYSWSAPVWVDDLYKDSDEIKEYNDEIHMINITQENGNTIIDFDIDASCDFVKSYKLTVDYTKNDIKLLSLQVTDKDYFSLCVDMNIVGIDYEFEKSTDLNSEQLFNYAMFVISDEEIGEENWNKWTGEWNDDELAGEGIPLKVIENALTMRLGEYNFNPEEIDCYDKKDKVFKCYIGQYGGARCPRLREKTMEDDILTLAIDYCKTNDEDHTEKDIHETIYTKMKINDDYSYKLLSIKKKNYD